MKFEFNHLEKSVLDSLSKKGRVYLVGGIVRDMVMYQKVDYHDVDVEIYDLEIDEIIDILSQYGKVNEVGKSFGILKLDCLPNFDFALPRIERKKGQTHREFEVEVHKNLDMKIACRRRDFTINAMMYDYQNEKLIDYYQGQEDIKNKCLKMVDEKTFYEDPLRVLRLAQFMARFEFQVDLKTKEICQKMVNEGVLQYLSLERIQQEYNKLLMSSHPSMGLKFLLELNALIRPLETLATCPQRLDFHPEGNVMNHTLLVVDLAALCKDKTSWPLAFMWSALLHDIGKPLVTTPEGKAPGHNESGVKVFNQYFSHFFTNKKMKKYIAVLLTVTLICSFGLTGCGTNSASSSKEATAENPMVLTLAHGLSESHTVHIAMLQFAEEVKQKTNGRIIIKIFPNGQLGSETENLEQLQAGVIAVSYTHLTLPTNSRV